MPTRLISQRSSRQVSSTHSFETIHPFLDGNGRLGRLLITFLLCANGILAEPLLYLSLHFKTHRYLYYNLLQHVRETGDWESWLEFFLNAIVHTSIQASETAHKILDLSKRDHGRIEQLGRPASSVFQVYRFLQKMPVISVPDARRKSRAFPADNKKSFKASASSRHLEGGHRKKPRADIRI